ncbi:biotin transporter BioY [Methylobacterium currus]|uniref:Biotin transporter n=1 Tax=Methylobacterium currus TaxID=2051553 RepID=A0A2R4WVQ4_9HYPH|nr:biotin transporter BioY [Methylobacterium currus]AWB25606.1 biotin transporter BioY [Methylobacterium currus]UHC19310.1 biotin transporter BioY [Methylobacterium currus]
MTALVVGGAPLRAARTVALVLSGGLLITLAAKVQIPFWPVPMTLHTLAILALSLAVGPRLAVAMVLGYLAAGAAGLPVFSGTPERGLGLAYMAGPTGGYLAGYLVAAGLVGALAAGRGFLGRVAAMLAGLTAVYVLGLAWLALFVPADRLVALGLAPFLLGDLVKVGLVAAGAAALPGLRRIARSTTR